MACLAAMLGAVSPSALGASATGTFFPDEQFALFNSGGEVVSSGQFFSRIALTAPAVFTTAGGVAPLPLEPAAIAQNGVVVGVRLPFENPLRWAVWSPDGGVVDLPEIDENSSARTISAGGRFVAGTSVDGLFLLDLTTRARAPIPPLPGTTTFPTPTLVNDVGQVILVLSPPQMPFPPPPRTFRWSLAAGYVELPFGSFPTSINNAGQFTGGRTVGGSPTASLGFVGSFASENVTELPAPARLIDSRGTVILDAPFGEDNLFWNADTGFFDPVPGCFRPSDRSTNGTLFGLRCDALANAVWTADRGFVDLLPPDGYGIVLFDPGVSDDGLVTGLISPLSSNGAVLVPAYWDTSRPSEPPAWVFGGFGAPWAPPPRVNEVKGGERVELRFQIRDSAGQPVTSLQEVGVTLASAACGKRRGRDDRIDDTEKKAGLRHLGDGKYAFVWQTDRRLRKTCATATFDFGRAGRHDLLVEFR